MAFVYERGERSETNLWCSWSGKNCFCKKTMSKTAARVLFGE